MASMFLSKVISLLVLFKTQVFWRLWFKKIGKRSKVYKLALIANPGHISIGDYSHIRTGSRLEVVTIVNSNAELKIGNNVYIEQNVHIACGNMIEIGDNVVLAGNCALVDISHPYMDFYDPKKIGDRLDCSKSLKIGEGSFIGVGAVILPGAHIGKRCVIGANAVVTEPIPDYSIAVGNPARIIKQYDFEAKKWIKI